MGITKEDYEKITHWKVTTPAKVFSRGTGLATSKAAIKEMAHQIRKNRVKELHIYVVRGMRDSYLAKGDFFSAACSAQLLAAWNIEFPNTKSIGIGHLDLLIRKYFK